MKPGLCFLPVALLAGPILLIAQPAPGHPLAGLDQLTNCRGQRDLQAKP